MHATKPNRQIAFTWIEMMVVIVCVVLLGFFIFVPRISKPKAQGARISCVNNLKIVGLAYRIYATDNQDHFPWQGPATNRPNSVPTNYATIPGTLLTPAQGVAANFAILSNELSTTKLVLCPSDAKRFQKSSNLWTYLMAPAQTQVRDQAISYFIGTSANEEQPQTVLGGDRNIAGAPFSADTNTPPSQVTLRIPHSVATNLATLKSAGWTKDVHKNAGNLLLGDGSVQQVSSGRLREQLRDAAAMSGSDLDFIWPAN